jgi:Cys-tRNA(Pro)/Cys-tRNA(Cys) deacylase
MGAGTPAVALLAEHGVPFTLHEYELEPLSGVEQHRGERIAYGDAAAAALGIAPDRLYKTLVLAIEGAKDARVLFALAVVPSSGELSEKAVATALRAKRAALADAESVRRVTGYVPGGVSPLGSKRPLPLLLDAGASAHPTIVVSAGQRGRSIELSPADLLRIGGGVMAPLSVAR